MPSKEDKHTSWMFTTYHDFVTESYEYHDRLNKHDGLKHLIYAKFPESDIHRHHKTQGIITFKKNTDKDTVKRITETPDIFIMKYPDMWIRRVKKETVQLYEHTWTNPDEETLEVKTFENDQCDACGA